MFTVYVYVTVMTCNNMYIYVGYSIILYIIKINSNFNKKIYKIF